MIQSGVHAAGRCLVNYGASVGTNMQRGLHARLHIDIAQSIVRCHGQGDSGIGQEEHDHLRSEGRVVVRASQECRGLTVRRSLFRRKVRVESSLPGGGNLIATPDASRGPQS